jgi:hypothetical protein
MHHSVVSLPFCSTDVHRDKLKSRSKYDTKVKTGRS